MTFNENRAMRWEYLRRNRPDQRELNALGADGWEVCAMSMTPDREVVILKRKVAT